MELYNDQPSSCWCLNGLHANSKAVRGFVYIHMKAMFPNFIFSNF